MADFPTVKEAANLTGKSSSSIRRVLYPIIADDSHKDRDQIKPSVEEVKAFRMKGETFPWRLSMELLNREFPPGAGGGKGSSGSAGRPSGSADGVLIAMLQRELDIKNTQIGQQLENMRKQTAVMETLSERLHEGNVLIGSLQKQLALGDGRGATNAENGTPTPAEPAKPKPSKTGKGSGSAPASKPKKKVGFFDLPHWLSRKS